MSVKKNSILRMFDLSQNDIEKLQKMRVAVLFHKCTPVILTCFSLLLQTLRESFCLEQEPVYNLIDLAKFSGDLLFIPYIADLLSIDEIDQLHRFVRSGCILFICVGSDAPRENRENVNFFLEEYGLSVCQDLVVDVREDIPGHPAESCVCGGPFDSLISYPKGCSLIVTESCRTLMSSGALCYPSNRPVLAVSDRVFLSGSFDLFANQNFDFLKYILIHSSTISPLSITEYSLCPDEMAVKTYMPCIMSPFEYPLNKKNPLMHATDFVPISDSISLYVDSIVHGKELFSGKKNLSLLVQNIFSQSGSVFIISLACRGLLLIEKTGCLLITSI